MSFDLAVNIGLAIVIKLPLFFKVNILYNICDRHMTRSVDFVAYKLQFAVSIACIYGLV